MLQVNQHSLMKRSEPQGKAKMMSYLQSEAFELSMKKKKKKQKQQIANTERHILNDVKDIFAEVFPGVDFALVLPPADKCEGFMVTDSRAPSDDEVVDTLLQASNESVPSV